MALPNKVETNNSYIIYNFFNFDETNIWCNHTSKQINGSVFDGKIDTWYKRWCDYRGGVIGALVIIGAK